MERKTREFTTETEREVKFDAILFNYSNKTLTMTGSIVKRNKTKLKITILFPLEQIQQYYMWHDLYI